MGWILLAGCTVDALCAASGISCEVAEPTDKPDPDADADADSDTDSDADSDADSDTDPVRFSLDGVSPAYTTSLGGVTATLTGTSFPDELRVFFGNTEATLLSASGRSLGVEVPPHAAGLVDVRVESGGTENQLEDAFLYIEDMSGATVMFGELGWYHYLGTYWSDQPVDEGNLFLAFIEGSDLQSSEFYTAILGSCEADYSYPSEVVVRDLGLESVELSGAASLVASSGDASAKGWYEVELGDGDFVQGGRYDLEPVIVSGMPDLEIRGLVQAPGAFTVTSPAINGSTPSTYERGTAITWSGTTSTDTVVVRLGLANAAASAYDTIISCAASASSGRLEVPSAVWPVWSANRQLDVFIGVMRNSDAESPLDHGVTQVAGIWWNRGAMFTR